MANYRDEIWKAVKEALIHGGEIKINFTKRGDKRIIIVQKFIDNYVRCDEETIVVDD